MKTTDLVVGDHYAVGARTPRKGESWTDADPNASHVTLADDRRWTASSRLSHGRPFTLADGSAVSALTAHPDERGRLVVVRNVYSGRVSAEALTRVLRPWAEHEALIAQERAAQTTAANQRQARRDLAARELTDLRDRLTDTLGGAPMIWAESGAHVSITARDLTALLELAVKSPS